MSIAIHSKYQLQPVGTLPGERSDSAVQCCQDAVMGRGQCQKVSIRHVPVSGQDRGGSECFGQRQVVRPETMSGKPGNSREQSHCLERTGRIRDERGFEETLTKPAWVIGQVRKPFAAFASNQPNASPWCT